MNHQTNSLMRFGILGCGIAGGIIGFLALVGVVVPVIPILLGVVIGIGGVVFVSWGFTRIVGHLLYRNDPMYQEWCRTSDPWFDTLPPPFRAPDHQVNIPPAAATVVCSCGTTVAEPVTGAFQSTGVVCPVCNALLQSH